MNVLITRTAEQSVDTVNLFSEAGLSPYCLPMIETAAVPAEFKYSHYDFCIISSPSAVKFFIQHSKSISVDQFIAVGPKTAQALQEFLKINITGIIVPDKFYMADIANVMSQWDLKDKKILSPGAEKRATDMHAFFEERGALYDAPATYSTAPVSYGEGVVDEFLSRYKIDAVTFFSPSAVNGFFGQAKLPDNVKIIAIGTTTRAAVPEGYEVIMPEEQTAKGIAELLKSWRADNV